MTTHFYYNFIYSLVFVMYVHFRSRNNLLIRQPSTPLPTIVDTEWVELDTDIRLRRSHTISEGALSRRNRAQEEGRSQRAQQTNEPIAEQQQVERDDVRVRERSGLEGPSEHGQDEEVRSKDDKEAKNEEEGGGASGGGASEDGLNGSIRTLKHTESVSDEVKKSPGFKFLTRPDLYKFVKVRLCVIVWSMYVPHY